MSTDCKVRHAASRNKHVGVDMVDINYKGRASSDNAGAALSIVVKHAGSRFEASKACCLGRDELDTVNDSAKTTAMLKPVAKPQQVECSAAFLAYMSIITERQIRHHA